MSQNIVILALSTFVILASNHALTSTKIRNINFIQSTPVFEQSYLQQKFAIKKNDTFSYNKLNEAISDLEYFYKNECYFEVTITNTIITTSDSLYCDILIEINPGEKYKVDKIFIFGNTFLTVDDVLQLMQTKYGSCLNQNLLESDIEKILNFYENNGFPWVTVKVNDIHIIESTKTITIYLEIDEKGKALIKEFKIEGNKKTNSKVIVRELRIKPGEIYNQEKIRKIPQILNRMQLFNMIENPEIYIVNDTVNLTRTAYNVKEKLLSAGLWIKLIEANTNYFDGVIGYLPGGLKQKGYFVGSIELSMRNLFGTARKLGFKWIKDEKLSQEISVKYTEPWLMDYPVNVKAFLFQRKQDTTFIKRYLELKSEFMFNENFSAVTSFSHENIISPSNILLLTNSRTLLLGLGVAYDTRNDLIIPSNGHYFRSDYYYGNKKLYAFSKSTSVQRYDIDLEYYKQIIPKQILMLGIHGKHFISSRVEISDLFRLGGTNTLRGYRENQFMGSRIYWANIEYRFMIANRSFFYGFLDLGYYYRKITDMDKIVEAYIYGYGLGFRVQTGIGIIGLSFALGKGDNLSQTKIHLGLINEF